MPGIYERHQLPYAAERIFDLVADVARYPEFLPTCVAVRVRRRPGDLLDVEQLLALDLLRWRFRSTAILRRPREIEIVSSDRPFRRLHIRWSFAPNAGRAGCDLAFQAVYALRSRRLERIIAGRLDEALRGTVAAFAARARALYGPAEPEPGRIPARRA